MVEVTGPNEKAVTAAFAAVAQVHSLMSAHERDSDLGRVNRFGARRPVHVHDLTAAVIGRALHWARTSNGGFDCVRAAADAMSRGLLPRYPDQPVLDPDADWRDIILQGNELYLRRPACIDLGGIAKGYAVDQAIQAMQENGAIWGFVNAGGDMRGFGDYQWKAIIVEPLRRIPCAEITLYNQAIATSAGHKTTGLALDFGHLPRRAARWASVTVRANEACDADALTKIVLAGERTAPAQLAAAGAQALGMDESNGIEEIEMAAAS